MPITTGYNSTEQANEILTALKDELTTQGVLVVTRGRLWKLPVRPCAVLLGPSVDTGPLSFRQAEATWTWMVLLARDVGEFEERSEELDTWADATMGCLMDWLVQTSVAQFELGGGDGPARSEDHQLVGLLERFGERVDATLIQFRTRNMITHPACA